MKSLSGMLMNSILGNFFNPFHTTIFFFTLYNSKLRVKSSGSIGNEISALRERDTIIRKDGRRDFGEI